MGMSGEDRSRDRGWEHMTTLSLDRAASMSDVAAQGRSGNSMRSRDSHKGEEIREGHSQEGLEFRPHQVEMHVLQVRSQSKPEGKRVTRSKEGEMATREGRHERCEGSSGSDHYMGTQQGMGDKAGQCVSTKGLSCQMTQGMSDKIGQHVSTKGLIGQTARVGTTCVTEKDTYMEAARTAVWGMGTAP